MYRIPGLFPYGPDDRDLLAALCTESYDISPIFCWQEPKKFKLMKSREDGGYDQEVMVISSSRAALGGFNDL
jgi:hypothetical protein